MKLIVGLGNPGDKYKNTRHNLGFLFLDYIKTNNNFEEFKLENKFKGEISNGDINGEKIILLKPQTFMNLSGESIRKTVDFYKINLEDLVIIYDDFSLDFGKIRYRDKGSAGGHNGVKDIIKHFGEKFNRIKVGIGFNDNYEISDWVLSKFNELELQNLDDDVFKNIYKLLIEKIN
ncbi:MAG: aminoacyl-tRNA hydrolase [Candidatus Gracilibacteria bacterium]|nr:aminoacyl-tRNA hydrolase [Candidatus Gracilibacteria bacterium]